MKKNNLLIPGAAALVALVAVGGIATSSFASDETTDTLDRPVKERRFWNFLDDEQKEEIQAKMEAKKAEREVQREAVKAALESGDYDAWVDAIPEDAPILEKITEDNFDRLVEMHELKEDARAIAEELGLEKGDMGHRKGHSRMGGRGMHGGVEMNK